MGARTANQIAAPIRMPEMEANLLLYEKANAPIKKKTTIIPIITESITGDV